MRIQLKQNEIEEAITSYLSRQGIAISGKNVEMMFTSGRKNNGLSVEVVIEDQIITRTMEETVMGITQSDSGTVVIDPDAHTTQAAPAVEAAAADTPVEVKPAGSLFGNT